MAAQFQLPLTGVLLQGIQQVLAGAFAAAAGLLADPAVLVVPGVPPAFIAAALADGHAGLQQRPGSAGIVFGQAAEDSGGGGADIGAVQAQPDALDHLGQVRLAQVGIGVGGTGLSAVASRVDGLRRQARVEVQGPPGSVRIFPAAPDTA